VQALVATTGYAIAGAPNLVLLGLLTAVFSFIPLIGTSIVWIPVTLWVAANHGLGWAAFLVAWSLGLTGTIDNVLRPLFLRGRSPIHPLLIFLSVLGGLYWLGLPGALVGPVTVAVFLALYRIWGEQLAEQGVSFPDATPPPTARLDVARLDVARLDGTGLDGTGLDASGVDRSGADLERPARLP
jgi:predicted PurR-regulated permease PerM